MFVKHWICWPHRACVKETFMPGVVCASSSALSPARLIKHFMLHLLTRTNCEGWERKKSISWLSFDNMMHVLSKCALRVAPQRGNFHWKLAALWAHENFIRGEASETLAVSLRRWTFPIQLLNWRKSWKKKRKEENIPSCCDNHNSHMFHSVDFRLLRLMCSSAFLRAEVN
jgi:hypothetical protein